jgi:uncharacterized repeat protein (TIGR03803 family)
MAILAAPLLLSTARAETHRVPYSFDTTNGNQVTAGLIFDQEGNLYGTTNLGGAYNGGVAFKLTAKGKETVLYSLCAESGCNPGSHTPTAETFPKHEESPVIRPNLRSRAAKETGQNGGFTGLPTTVSGCS